MRKKCLCIASLLLATLFLVPVQGLSKDLNGKLGVGFNTQFTNQENMDGVSVKIWPRNAPVGLQALGGWQLGDQTDEVTLGSKVIYPLKQEENMYVYVAGGMGVSYIDPENDDDDMALSILPSVGVEYFFQGLPNLGFSSELGGRIFFSDRSDEFESTANTGTSVTVGIHYYFQWL